MQAKLTITRDSIQNPVSTLLGSVPVTGVPRSMTLYQNGPQQLAYVCADSAVNIVDVTNPASPQALSTFATNILTTENSATVPGFQVMACSIYNQDLILSYSRYDGNTTANPIPTHFATFSLANPLSPTQVGSVVDISRADSSGLYVAGNTALMFQSTTFYNPFSNFIFQETGDIWAGDLSTAATNGNIAFLNDTYPCGGLNGSNQCNNTTTVPTGNFSGGACVAGPPTTIPNDQTRGGPFRIGLGTAINSTTTFFASTDAYGGNILNPSCPQIHGQLVVVDTTTPTSPQILTRVNAPAMTFMTGVAAQGNIALAVGDSTGVYDINSGYTGTLVLSSFDISNPTNPVLLNSVTTQLADKAGSFVVPLGSNTFAVGNTTQNLNAELVLVDATNPNALRYVPYDAAFVANPTIARNGFFYALSATPSSTQNALSVFQLSQITGPQLTVKLLVPNTANAAVAAGSFNQTPSSSTPGTGFTTYVWNQPSLDTITFNMNLTGVNPGDVTSLVNSGELDYTLPSLGSGVLQLGGLSVLTQHILSISPGTQTVPNAGMPGSYTGTVTNPTGVSQTFNLSVIAPPGWTNTIPSSVTVAASGSQTFPVTVTPPANAQANSYTFNVAANSLTGISDSVPAVLNLSTTGANLGFNGSQYITPVSATIAPSQVTVGQGGTSGPYSISVTNAGNSSIFGYSMSPPANLPLGLSAFAYTPSPFLNPPPNATAVANGTVSANRGTTPGTYSLTIPVQSASNTQNLSLSVVVSSAGVGGFISPSNGPPTSGFTLNVSNLGLTQDTYALSVIGPMAAAVTVPPAVTVAPNTTSAPLPITFGSLNYLLLATAPLQIKAVSQNDPNVFTLLTANVTIPQAKAVSAAITPSSTTAGTPPSTVPLLFRANNTGNVSDNYSAQITATTGPVTAQLVDANGNAGTSIASFYAPALGTAQFPLNARVTGSARATVTVAVTSLSSPSVTSSSTVTINGAGSLPPVANAGTGGTIPLQRLAVLNGTASSDPNAPPLSLTYAWTLVTAPAGSAVTTSSIGFASGAVAVFRPDVAGTYTFQLTVTSSAGSSTANVTYTAQLFPPVAVPGKTLYISTGKYVFTNGKDSYDPNSLPLTFAWTMTNKPSGSIATLSGATTPRPYFLADTAGSYMLQLIVSNGTLQSTPQTVTVVASAGVAKPSTNAGLDRNAAVGQAVSLDGTGTFDANIPALALTYGWMFTTVPAGSALTNAQITGATTTQPSFVPDATGDYVLDLRATSSTGFSDDTVTVHAFAGQSHGLLSDAPPNAVTGPSQFVLPGTVANLTAASSADPDSGPAPLAYNWWVDAAPTGSGSALASKTTSTPRVTPDPSGYYIARVEATDTFASGFSNALVTAAQKCDVDANGTITQTDIAIMTAALGQATLANDPRDPLAAGSITQADVNYCQGLVNPSLPTAGSTPPSLSFTTSAGVTPASQNLTVTSSGTAFSFTVSTTQPWLTAAPTVGSTSSNSISVGINMTGLTAATYTGAIVITAAGASNSPFSIPVTLTVQATSITATAGAPQTALLGAAFGTTLQAQVKDAGGNPLSGITVTFTAPSSGAGGTFAGGATSATAVTNASGIAISPVFTANSTAGNYTVTATAAGAAAPANFVLSNVVSGPTSLGGAIAGKSGPQNARVWVFQMGNNGTGSALNAQITSIAFTQTSGAACTPTLVTPLPLNAGNIAPGVTANVSATIDFTGCAATAAFTVTAQETASNGAATGTIVRLNQFQ